MSTKEGGKRSHPILGRILFLVIGVAVACAGFFLLRAYGGSFVQYGSRMTSFDLHDIGVLVTQEGRYTAVQSISGARREFGITFPFTNKTYIYSMDGTVQAGIDFAKIELKEDPSRKKLTVSLPPAKVLALDPDRDSFTVYYESNNMFNALHLTDTNQAEKAAEEEIRAKAVEYGILEHATENAKTLVRAMLLQVYDGTEWTIEFETQKEE